MPSSAAAVPLPVDQAAQPGSRSRLALEVLICSRESFPAGTAQTIKMGLQARALQRAGCSVKILLLDAFERPEQAQNLSAAGIWHDIPFEYTAGATVRASNPVVRLWRKLRGFSLAAWQIVRPSKLPRSQRCVFFFMHGVVALGLLLLLCRAFGIKTLYDLCEWPPAFEGTTALERWYFESGAVFSLSDGIIPISKFLEQKVLDRDAGAGRKMLRISNLIDQAEFVDVSPASPPLPYVLWAGMLPEYEDTVLFLIQAFAVVHRAELRVDLLLCGKCPPESRERIFEAARLAGIPADRIRFPGFVSRQELLSLYAGARALLIPMGDDDRSRARFPFKLGEYLSARRPVVTSSVGDIPLYLANGRTAMLCAAGDAAEFGTAIVYLVQHPDAGNAIGQAGYEVARQNFAFTEVGGPLRTFIQSLSTGG